MSCASCSALAEAGFYPGVILYLTYWFPSHRRAQIIAVFMSAIRVGHLRQSAVRLDHAGVP